MINIKPPLLALLFIATFSGCYSDPMSERGFRLPEGDAEGARAAGA